MSSDIYYLLIQRFPVEPHGQEPVAPAVRRNPPKLQSSFACPPEVGQPFGRELRAERLRRVPTFLHLLETVASCEGG